MSSEIHKGKKPRCMSAEKMAFRQQKRAERWSSMGVTKQVQVRIDAKLALEQEQRAVAAAQQKLAAGEVKLNEKEAELMHKSREKFREADAAKAEAKRSTAWANNLISKELSGNKLSRALTFEAKMLAYGIVDQPYARRAAAKKLAQEEMEPSSLSVLNKGESVWYFHKHGRISPATIKEVHYEDVVPYYVICFDDDLFDDKERDTVREKLVPMSGSA